MSDWGLTGEEKLILSELPMNSEVHKLYYTDVDSLSYSEEPFRWCPVGQCVEDTSTVFLDILEVTLDEAKDYTSGKGSSCFYLSPEFNPSSPLPVATKVGA